MKSTGFRRGGAPLGVVVAGPGLSRLHRVVQKQLGDGSAPEEVLDQVDDVTLVVAQPPLVRVEVTVSLLDLMHFLCTPLMSLAVRCARLAGSSMGASLFLAFAAARSVSWVNLVASPNTHAASRICDQV